MKKKFKLTDLLIFIISTELVGALSSMFFGILQLADKAAYRSARVGISGGMGAALCTYGGGLLSCISIRFGT